jgi:hypothetical protein
MPAVRAAVGDFIARFHFERPFHQAQARPPRASRAPDPNAPDMR